MKFQHTEATLHLKSGAGSNIAAVILEGIKACLEYDMSVCFEFNGVKYKITKEKLLDAIAPSGIE